MEKTNIYRGGYVERIIQYESVILGKNLFGDNAHLYPEVDLKLAVVKKLIKCN